MGSEIRVSLKSLWSQGHKKLNLIQFFLERSPTIVVIARPVFPLNREHTINNRKAVAKCRRSVAICWKPGFSITNQLQGKLCQTDLS